jgi:asparagine synthase (glutamine-hydrolysing)
MDAAGIHMFFSYEEDFVGLRSCQITVNWNYVSAHAAFPLLQSRKTALNEINEVQPGERVALNRNGCTYDFLWNPLRIAATSPLVDPIEAADVLQRTTVRCVESWASSFDNVIHRLSGGLDSSVVLSCIANSPHRPRITCINYYSHGSNMDERAFARLGATRANCKLIEKEREIALRIEPMANIYRSAKPSFYFGYLISAAAERDAARENDAPAIFGGGFGDQLFYEPGMYAASDYLQSEGLRQSFISVSLDAAQVERKSIWHILRHAMLDAVVGKRQWRISDEAGRGKKLICSDTLEAVAKSREFEHPWFRQPTILPTGKLFQIWLLSFPQPFYDPYMQEDDPERVEPLMSQPLIEVCLRIPTYVLIRGGRGRALARKAFASTVPPEIMARRIKGGLEQYTKEVWTRNLQFSREQLLDGFLVKERVLDRKKLEEVLSGRPTAVSPSPTELFCHLSTEIWLRKWNETRARAAA